ncbi:MAG: RHS repeat domain-containing protein [Gemmatimonadales bacterium]
MTEVRDRWNNITTILYDASNRVSQVKDPLNFTITLTYDGNGLDFITDPMARVTQVTVDASKRLTLIRDPDLVGTSFGYDANLRLSTITNRRGHTTTFAYHAQSGLLDSIMSPTVTFVGSNGSDSTRSLTTRFAPWQMVGVPYALTSPAVTPPRADTIYARVWDAGGHVTRFTVNRWGTPVQTTDALNGVTTVMFDANGLRSGTDSATFIHYAAWAQPDTIRGFKRPTEVAFIGPNGRVDSSGVINRRPTRYTYDARGRVERVIDPENHLVQRTWFAGVNGNRSRDSLPGNRVTLFYQDAIGRDTAVKPPVLPLQRTRYDVLNRPIRFFDGVNDSATVTTYDALYVTSVRDPKLQVYGFTYNALGWLTNRTDPLNRSDLYGYGRDGELRRWTNRRGHVITYTHDVLHRPTGKSGDSTTTVGWSYSSDRRVVTSTSPVSAETVYLSAMGRADSAKTVLAGQTYWRRFAYDAGGRLDSLFASGPSVTFRSRKYTYDDVDGALNGVKLSGATTMLGHNNDGLPTTVSVPGGPTRTTTYYPLHGEAGIRTTASYNERIARSLSFDPQGRVEREVFGSGLDARQFDYDSLDRLITVTDQHRDETQNPCAGDPIINENGEDCVSGTLWQDVATRSYWYDAVGNRNDHGGTYATGNRIQTFAGCTYTTDVDGNVTQRACPGDTVTFSWSAENRLTGYTRTGSTIAFQYDAHGRLVRKDIAGSPVRYFLWNGNDLLAELNGGANAKVAEYSYLGMDRPHAIIVSDTAYYAHQDAFGNVTALTDSTSAGLKRTYYYDSWGQLIGGSDIAGFAGADRARFKGALWMGEEIELYYMRNRWYEPKSGRFLSEDPTGIMGGLNVYIYAANDPVNGRDPTGLLSCSDGVTIIIDDVPVPCSEAVLGAIDGWLRDAFSTTLDQAWEAAGGAPGSRSRFQQQCPAILRNPGVEAGWRWTFAQGLRTGMEWAAVVRQGPPLLPSSLYSEYITEYQEQREDYWEAEVSGSFLMVIHNHPTGLEILSPDDIMYADEIRVPYVAVSERFLTIYTPTGGAFEFCRRPPP